MGFEDVHKKTWFELLCGKDVVLDESAYCLLALESRKLDEI